MYRILFFLSIILQLTRNEEVQCGVSRHLSLSKRNMEILKERSFEKCKNLKHIFISNTNLTIIERLAFENLTNLTDLTIVDNNLRKLNGSVRNLPSLESINLSRNKIEKIEADMFLNTNNLKNIFMDKNRISVIERGAFDGLKKINRLSLNFNQFTELPAIGANFIEVSFNNLVKLEISETTTQIEAGNNRLKEIICPERMKIMVLDVHNNQLENLSCIPKMSTLEGLLLQGNPLKNFPKGLPKALNELNSLTVDNLESYEDLNLCFPKLRYFYTDVLRWNCSYLKHTF
jgi:Leucine-rich repeat (LRR) protein